MKKSVTTDIKRIGLNKSPLSDFYHSLLLVNWRRLMVLTIIFYFVLNVIFAAVYRVIPNSIANAEPNSFTDAFFFSVQTMSTIGYGHFHPVGIAANVLATIEAMIGLIGFAVVAGLMFAKFSRPTAKVIYSRNAVIGMRDGVPSLMVRLANSRNNRVMDAGVGLIMMRNETTAEGESLRRLHDLPLVREKTPVFTLSWTVVHPIVPGSPMFNVTREQMQQKDVEFIVTFSGLDETFAQQVSSRHLYSLNDLRWGVRFADIFVVDDTGQRVIDYRHFHDTVALS